MYVELCSAGSKPPGSEDWELLSGQGNEELRSLFALQLPTLNAARERLGCMDEAAERESEWTIHRRGWRRINSNERASSPDRECKRAQQLDGSILACGRMSVISNG